MNIRHVTETDLEALVAIEQASFTPEEAATKEAFQERIQMISDSFFVAELAGEVVGLINGPVVSERYISDDLFTHIQPNRACGGHQTVLGVAVHPHYRKQGIGAQLLYALEQQAKAQERETVTLTCQALLVPFYERLGYQNEGQSSSSHAGITWFNLVKPL